MSRGDGLFYFRYSHKVISKITTIATAMPVNATAPRCSSRVTAVLNYPGLLTQPDARLGPAFHRRIESGLGQHEVLDARQVVGDTPSSGRLFQIFAAEIVVAPAEALYGSVMSIPAWDGKCSATPGTIPRGLYCGRRPSLFKSGHDLSTSVHEAFE